MIYQFLSIFLWQSNFVFNSRGTGYAISDQLTLSSTIPNKSSYAPGTTTSFAATLNVASTTVTISDTSSLVAGMTACTLHPRKQ